LHQCICLSDNIALEDNAVDRWVWHHNTYEGYIVKGAYQIITQTYHAHHDIHADLIWNKDVPLKVSLFSWRIFNKMISTNDN
jgi:hypothetical protein